MAKYRIVEETGNLTKTKRYYIEKQKRKFFGGYKWVTHYEYHPEGGRRIKEFSDLEKAKEWVDYWNETVKKQYHYCWEANEA